MKGKKSVVLGACIYSGVDTHRLRRYCPATCLKPPKSSISTLNAGTIAIYRSQGNWVKFHITGAPGV